MPASLGHASSTLTLHRAPWLVMPGGGGEERGTGVVTLVADGGLVLAGQEIEAAGRFRDLREKFATARTIDHEGTVLMPTLVNCHAHLELALLGQGGDREPAVRQGSGDFPDWIRSLLARLAHGRDIEGAAWPERLVAAGRRDLDDMCRQGVGAVLDVGNRPASGEIGAAAPARTDFFLEMLGLSGRAEEKALLQLKGDVPPGLACTPHAPYSCGPELLRALKKRATAAHRLLTIHVAESAAEIEFLGRGCGPFRSFLTERGVLDDSFAVPGCGPVEYLDRLGLLDPDTLCVHGVHLAEQEIGILAARGATLCLCPGSNRYLAVGRAPVERLLAAGVALVLGTDSRASNPVLSMWREMRLLREDHPGLHPAPVLAMATAGGERLLRPAARRPGREAAYLEVRPPGDGPLADHDQVLEFLTLEGEKAAIARVGNR